MCARECEEVVLHLARIGSRYVIAHPSQSRLRTPLPAGHGEGGMTTSTRPFPQPWSIRELELAFVVQDANGQAVAYAYFRKNGSEARHAKSTHARRDRADRGQKHHEAAELLSCKRAVFLTVLHRLFVSGSDRAADRWREDW